MTKIKKETLSFKVETFSTTDLLLATILRTKDFELLDWQVAQAGQIRKVEFFFKQEPGLMKEVNLFFTDSNSIFRKFYQEYKNLKNIIYNS